MTFHGRSANGQILLKPHHQDIWNARILELDGQRVHVTLEPAVSLDQHGYYRSTILPVIREASGYESDALAHQALKAAFYDLDPRGPLPSMAAMDQGTASRFIEFALRQAAEMNCPVADPRVTA